MTRAGGAELQLVCRCGAWRARVTGVSPARANRVTCYCRDCRAFARALGRADILDAWGGSEIVQVPADCLQLDLPAGGDPRIGCLQLSPGGLLRWHTTCCKSPIGNTLTTPDWPFIGLLAATIRTPPVGLARDNAIGPLDACVFGSAATGTGPDAERIRATPTSRRSLWRAAKVLVGSRLRGAGRRHPLFPDGRLPYVAARVLQPSERAALAD